MRKQDTILLAGSFGAMAIGVFTPFLAEPLAWAPRFGMLCMLFISFLAVDGREAWLNLVHYPLAVFLIALLKLVVMPVVCWHVFQLVLPEYALGATLVAGAATAVAAPFFAFMVQADAILVLVSLVATSLLMPFVLPLVLAFLGAADQTVGGVQVALPVIPMMVNLLVMMVLPFIAAQIVRHTSKRAMDGILRRRQGLFLVLTVVGNLAIFSMYSPVIMQTPQYVFMAFLCACLACFISYVLVSAGTFWLPPVKQLAFVISCVSVNGVAVLIISIDFFGAPEALTTAMAAGPLYLGLPLFRFLGKLRGFNPK